jgi:hypothetical protein
MIIIRIAGGLGNQMFQYAFGRRLAYFNNTNLKMDISLYEGDHKRSHRLHHFNITGEYASADEVAVLLGNNKPKINRWSYKLGQRLLPINKRKIIKERKFNFDQQMIRSASDTYVMGYWQSEKYFKDIAFIIQREFTLKSEPDEKNKSLLESILRKNSVCIHIRRGDYVSDPVNRTKHGTCPMNYYYRCAEFISNRIENAHYFIFSDEPMWAINNFWFSNSSTFISQNGSSKDYEDLRLMTSCKHFIIANSSFSWWGAWLSNNPGKIVCAPRKWFNNAKLDTSDLIPEEWIKI